MVNPHLFQRLKRSLFGLLAGRFLVLARGRRLGHVDRVGSWKRVLEALVERAVETALGVVLGPVLFASGILFRVIHGVVNDRAACASIGVDALRAPPSPRRRQSPGP